MKITLIAVGGLKEEYLKDAQDHYISRIKNRVGFEVIEVRDEPDPGDKSKKLLEDAKSIEAARILSMIPAKTRTVLLDICGQKTGIEQYINNMRADDITFIIGGSNGFGKEVYAKVKDRISFSDMTFPHQLARIILLDVLDKAIY